jgi:hypothetical protein
MEKKLNHFDSDYRKNWAILTQITGKNWAILTQITGENGLF